MDSLARIYPMHGGMEAEEVIGVPESGFYLSAEVVVSAPVITEKSLHVRGLQVHT